jgi:lipopolysaccharide transport system ATP-binding protein
MNSTHGIRVENVSKKFCRNFRRSLAYGARDILGELAWWRLGQAASLRRDEFWAVQDVSFTLQPGEALGVVGENGAGKSTLLKLLNGLLKPDIGCVKVEGRTCAMDLGSGMIPLLTGRENIFAQAALLGYSRNATQKKLDSIINFAELETFIDTTVGYYSTGMRARLAFAIAAHLEPDILLVDEVLAVGDLGFQRKCLTYINGFLQRGGIMVLVSHSIHQIQFTCQRGLVMDHGQAIFADNAVNAMDFYLKHKQFEEEAPAKAPAVSMVATPAPSAKLTDRDPVRIDQVRIQPLEGLVLQTGKPAHIQISYTSLAHYEKVSWSFVIYNRDQTVCITGALRTEPTFLVEGRGTLGCIVPHLPLTNGVYMLKVGINDLDARVPLAQSGWSDGTHPFQVENDASVIYNMASILNVLVTLEVDWEESAILHEQVSGDNGNFPGS